MGAGNTSGIIWVQDPQLSAPPVPLADDPELRTLALPPDPSARSEGGQKKTER